MCLQQVEDKSLESEIQERFGINEKERVLSDEYWVSRFYSNLGQNISLNSSPEPLSLNKTFSLEDVFTVVYVFCRHTAILFGLHRVLAKIACSCDQKLDCDYEISAENASCICLTFAASHAESVS